MGNSPIVNRINSLLAEKGIDKKKFYSDCGITSASYSLWNTGKTKPRMKNLEIIADYLNVSVSYLLDGTVKKEKPASNGDEPDKEKSDLHQETGLSAAKQKLLSIFDDLTDEQCEKLFGIIEEARKLL